MNRNRVYKIMVRDAIRKPIANLFATKKSIVYIDVIRCSCKQNYCSSLRKGTIMRLLRLSITGVSLYESDKLNLDLYATDRVLSSDIGLEDVCRFDSGNAIYSQNVIGISGVNASGKTTTLNLLRFVLSQLTGSYSMRGFKVPANGLGKVSDVLTLQAVFWHEGDYYLIDSTLKRDGAVPDLAPFEVALSYAFADESIWRYGRRRVNRATIADPAAFKDGSKLLYCRGAASGEIGYISEDVRLVLGEHRSIASLVTKKVSIVVEAPERSLPAITMPTKVVQAFDGSVEGLAWDSDSQVFRLKFKGEPERVVGMEAAVSMLSRGTVYGAELVDHAIEVLSVGGYFIVDEIEESLNRALVAVIIDLFSSPVTNPHGAQMVFSTHYPELLDCLNRKDCVYVLTRNSDFRTKVVKYSDVVNRIENKKSEAILSNLIKGSMPKYSDVQGLREYVKERVNG